MNFSDINLSNKYILGSKYCSVDVRVVDFNNVIIYILVS